MSTTRRTIIVEPVTRAARRAAWRLGALAAAIGSIAAWHYARLGLTLSHYDARAHLVVARRVVDNLTPGWRQLGGLWLPLPHLLNLLPVQWDWSYRTGFSAVAISVAALAWGIASLHRLATSLGATRATAWTAAALLLLNPNVLYLQSTPMTEALLIGLSLAALAAVVDWHRAPDGSAAWPGALLALLVLTRYEGWAIAGALLAGVALARPRPQLQRTAALAAAPAAAIIGFLLMTKGATDEWIGPRDFFVPNNPALAHPLLAVAELGRGIAAVAGWPTLVAAAAGTLWCLWRAWRQRSLAPVLPLALAAAAAVPLAAFIGGHPFRVRYAVPGTAAAAVLGGLGVMVAPRRARGVVAAAIVATALWTNPPFAAQAPVIQEAQWERPYSAARVAISNYLAAHRDGTPIMLSEGSLGHYTQQLAAYGFFGRDFLHEGNGDLWAAALAHPARYVRWIVIEEEAEGGDMLAQRARVDPSFLAGFTPVARGGGAVLYERTTQ